MERQLIYNLTTHFCSHQDVELEPRVEVMTDPRDMIGCIKAVKALAKNIPNGAKVLVGGHSQIVGLVLQAARIKQWQVFFYSTYDDRVYPAAFLSKMDRFEIERGE